MHKIISKKLDYWAEVLDECASRKDNPSAVLNAIADDIKEWVDIIKTFDDLTETAQDGDQIIIYTREPNSGISH